MTNDEYHQMLQDARHASGEVALKAFETAGEINAPAFSDSVDIERYIAAEKVWKDAYEAMYLRLHKAQIEFA